MLKFKEFMESQNESGVIVAIADLLRRSEELPDTDDQEELFGNRNYRDILIHYYQNLLKDAGDPADNALREKLADCDLKDEPYKVYRVINAPEHAVRAHLIILHNVPNGLKSLQDADS